MHGLDQVATGGLPPPEPGLTPTEIVARAAALRERLRVEQDEAEANGRYSAAMHEAFCTAGFYRILRPRSFGGYEFDLPTFYRVVLEIARGHPGAAWCFALAASHVWVFASHWPESAQRDCLGTSGEFIAALRGVPEGSGKRVEGGYVFDGTWRYASGSPYSTWFIGTTTIPDESSEKPRTVKFLVPRDRYALLDDWGGDRTLGLQASGSNSVRLNDVFVPEDRVVDYVGMFMRPAAAGEATPGTRLHGNPIYLGPLMVPYHLNLLAVVLGAAYAAIDEYVESARTKKSPSPPHRERLHDSDAQQAVGQAIMLADTAEAALFRVAELFMERCRRWAEHGTPFSVEENLRLWGICQNCGNLASQAIDVLFRTSGTGVSFKGQKLQRYLNDAAMYRTHPTSSEFRLLPMIGRAHFGLPSGMPGL